jgi:hypothetical protein
MKYTPSRVRRLVELGLILASITSCDSALSTGLAGISSPITFAVREVAGDPSGRAADPVMAVLLEYDPRNESGCSALEAELGVSATVVTIHLLGLRAADCVPDANGCACSQLMLPRLAGDYELRIVTDGRADQYTLAVTASAIVVTPTHAEFTEPRVTHVWRYPENSFAAVCYTGTADGSACSDFAAAVASVSGLTTFDFPAGGEIPYPKTEDVYIGAYRVFYYRYATEDAFTRAGERLRALLPAFHAAFPAGFLYLTNWRGVLLQ